MPRVHVAGELSPEAESWNCPGSTRCWVFLPNKRGAFERWPRRHILKTHPEAILCGDVSDYHLVFPQYEHRMQWMKEGDEIDFGGRTLMAVEPVIRDLRTTWWGFDTRERVLFPGDGFAYSHYHEDGHCGLVAEEAISLDLPDVSSTFADLALFWTKFADMNVYCDRLDRLIERLGVKTIAPTHGLA
jgi:flavorubredoxin